MKSADVKARARELGFDACGVASADAHPELGFFRQWLDRGFAGRMTYLNRSARRRADVRNWKPSARTLIVTATNYNTDRPYSTESTDPHLAHIARYAWGDDYHVVIRRRLDALVEWMRQETSEPFDAHTCVDTAPVQERVYAQRAGIGWIGKNTCVINPALGSLIFLGEIICSLPLEIDTPSLDQCGTCALCLEACPTGAFPEPGVLDATRCISYLTIEVKGALKPDQQKAIGSHVYGCDVCQEVCPWNAASPRSGDPAWQPRPMWDQPDVRELSTKSDDELAAALEGGPMQRREVKGLRRNLAAASANARRSCPDCGGYRNRNRRPNVAMRGSPPAGSIRSCGPAGLWSTFAVMRNGLLWFSTLRLST